MIIRYRDSSIVYYDFVVPCSDETPGEMFQLLPGLHEQVTTGGWKLDEDTFSSISSPYVKAWVSRTAMNSQKVEVGVEASKDSIFVIIFHEI